MVKKKYIPDQGDICYVDISPTKGHELYGIRPVLVISTEFFSKMTGMAIICPITSNNKEFPLHYKIINGGKIRVSVLVEHIKSLDFNNRKFTYVSKLNKLELTEIIGMIFSEVDLKGDI